MRQLQDLFDKQIQDQLRFSVFIADVIESELRKRDIHLTVEQKQQLIKKLEKNKDSLNDSMSIQINDDGSIEITNGGGESDFELDLLDSAKLKMNALLENFPSIINDASDTESEKYLRNIKKRTSSILKENSKHQKNFNKQLDKKWGKLLDLLEIFVVLSEDVGAEFTDCVINSLSEDTSPRFIVTCFSFCVQSK